MQKLRKSSKVSTSTQPSKVLETTFSVCPVCLRRIDARYLAKGETVLLSKTCPDHGVFEIPVWEGVEHFLGWRSRQNLAQRPANPDRKTEKGCPYDCGLCENHLQASCCVLLELTHRCDLRCPVCFASADSNAAGPDPSVEKVGLWYERLLARGGPFNIQLSGGEPTMRSDLPEIIRMGKTKGFSFFQLNTNGLRIAREPEYAETLAQAGLSTVFLQFDSLKSEACAALRGRDLVAEKLRAIDNCAKAGLGVALVPTVRRGVNDSEIGDLIVFAASRMPTVRGIHFQPMSFFGRYSGNPRTDRLTLSALLVLAEEQSGGRIKAADFLPGGAEHPQCSFHAKYRVQNGVWTLRKSSGNTGCCEAANGNSNTSDAARRAVARQWSAVASLAPAQTSSVLKGFNLDSLDKFVAAAERQEKETIEVSGMAFQDAWTADLKRFSRCHINVVNPEGLLMPFCAYNLTAVNGKRLHRPYHKETHNGV